MKKSLGRKLCWIGTLLIVAFVLLNVVLTYFFMAPFSVLFYREQMSELGDTLKGEISGEEELFVDMIEELDTVNGVKVTIIDGEKDILYTTKAFIKSTSEYWKQSMKLFESEREKIDNGEEAFLTRNRQRKNNQKTIQLVMIQKIDDNRYAVISRSYQSIYNAMHVAIIFDLIVGIFIVLFGWIVVYRLSRHLVVPIRQMTDAAENISNLKFDTKVNVSSEDEVGQLGNSINKMSEQLERNMSQLQEDIESRKHLVRNLSHEIKSPVAVIMGYSDRLKTVLSKNPEKALKYCEIISGESARIDLLAREMLELSRIEQQTEGLNKEYFDIKGLFESIKYRFYEENMERNISYKSNFDESEHVYADYTLLERALYNLIQNAVSHSGTSNMEIMVTGERKGEYYEMRVYNSGSHIDEREIVALWEPFTKVDKVRTRGKHGYGVGLAIVREIIEYHEGYYSVQNLDNGVEFTIAIQG